MTFRTKLDYSDNRQIRQTERTHTILSGGTAFGLSFSALTSGPDPDFSGVSQTQINLVSTFSGNNSSTVYSWYDNDMNLAITSLSAITPSNSATTQNTGNLFTASSTTIIDENVVALAYTGVNFDISVIAMVDLGGSNYSGSVFTATFQNLSANTLDFTGRTIWVDVSGITRTQDLIITNNPVIGYVWKCLDLEGRGYWGVDSSGTTGSTSYWSAGTGTNAIVLKNSGSISSGILSVVEGYLSTASGNYTHSEGNETTASGRGAHAEGEYATASGVGSHAEGGGSRSSGIYSHAEGEATSAMGNSSHSEGSFTIASGLQSHAEGGTTTAIGTNSHAEGLSTIASGITSHSEGTSTKALGANCHAEGAGTTASGTTSHAEGYLSKSFGPYSHAEGIISLAYGTGAHAEGNQTTSSGQGSHSEGSGTSALGDSAHAEGYVTVAIGIYAHSEGNQTLALGDYSHAEGSSTTASGATSHAEGAGTVARGNYTHSEGSATTARGDFSHAEGIGSNANGYTSHAEGFSVFAIGDYSHAEGYSSIASGQTSHAEGYATTAVGNFSHSEGQQTTAFGTYSHAGGINSTASGLTSFIHSTNSLALGDRCVVLGGQNLTGTTNDYVYVPSLNINSVGSSAFANDIRIDATGNLTTNTSDIRFKENINSIVGALDKIKQLRGVTYQWKDKIAGGDGIKLGFIAQEVDEIESNLVFTNKVDGYKGIHIDGIIPLLVEAVKELANGVTNSNNTLLETQTILAEDNNIELNYSGNNQTSIGGGITILHALGVNLNAELKTDIDGNWITNNDFKPKALTIPNYTPTSSTDITGNYGNITSDDTYLYVKTTDRWKRIKLEDF